MIESRLAQLSGPARDLVGVAATIGREFTTDVLAQASQAGEEALVAGLDELWRRRLVRDQGPDAYDFTHDRIREVAYLGLSPARRRHTHLLVARALERLHAGDPAPVAAQLAAHHERAGQPEEAVAWYQRAASAAQRLPAYAEAVRLLERALRLVQAGPPTPAGRERELAVLTRLQGPLGVVDGYASERLAEVQRRGLELAAELGVEPAPPLLRSTATTSLARGDFEGARRVGERLRAGAAPEDDDLRAVQGEYVLGLVAFWKGEFETARRHFQAAVDRFRPERRSARLARYGRTTEVLCTSRLGNTLGFLGRPEAALRARDAALARARESGHPHSREAALTFGAMLALELRDPASVRAQVAELAARPGDLARPTRVVADGLAGYVEVLDGQEAAGIARIRRALEDPTEGEHAPGMHTMVARLLLEACAAAGDARTGLVAADRCSTSTTTSAPGSRRPGGAAGSSWPPSATTARPSCGAPSRSPAARAPGCSSCGRPRACCATGSTAARPARCARRGRRWPRSSRPSPRDGTPPTCARRWPPRPELSGNAARNARGTPRPRSCLHTSERRPR